MAVPILEVTDLRKEFYAITAVDDVSFSVDSGSITSIIGPNGAGKSTLFDLITGLTPVTAGTIVFQGTRIESMDAHEISRLGISRSFQITNIFSSLTPVENVEIALFSREPHLSVEDFFETRNDEVAEKARRILDDVGMNDVRDQAADSLSHGKKRHLEIAIGVASDPDLFLLDEPTQGMSPEETEETKLLIEEVSSDFTTMVIEHDMSVVLDISDSIGVMNHGAFIAMGSPQEIQANEAVQRAYLKADDGEIEMSEDGITWRDMPTESEEVSE